ncbi:MAG: DUF3047 domain-containing protein [Halioglobus sp.]|nr:DUF3047 domain-containing protein [Halioglobus sp.]
MAGKAHHAALRALGLVIACGVSLGAHAQRLEVARFSAADLSGWEEKHFAGETRYQLRDNSGRHALCAHSEAAASGLFKKIDVDLERTPYLHWSWKVDTLVDGGDERRKQGDDYPARIYVVFSGGLFFWRTRAVNYVWSRSEPPGSAWPNAFTANAQMIAVRSGTEELGQWLSERRDVKADYRRLFGSEAGTIAAVALMTDSDNTKSTAAACYGDIWFAAD